jgi:hypothetical protein
VKRVRRFLKQVTDTIRAIPFNPAITLWDSARKDERKRRRRS